MTVSASTPDLSIQKVSIPGGILSAPLRDLIVRTAVSVLLMGIQIKGV